MKKVFLSIAVYFFINQEVFSQIKILFDNTKAETAANADWVIDADLRNMDWNPYGCTGCGGNEANPAQLPTPAQSGITGSTAESYWAGSLSHWGIDCVNKGYVVETLPYLGQITYGNTSNAQDLSNYKIYIVDEPNILFTASQKTAIMNFILNGGSLFMISDHTVSDRNNDGYDSPAIWNDFISNNGIQNNGFGFSVDLQNFSQTSTNIVATAGDSIIHGPFGNVTQVKWSNGTSLTLNPTQNASVTGVVYKTGASGNTGVLCAYARVGCGKVGILADSSPPDDGTGDPNDFLYNGYIVDAAGNHQKLIMNMTIWLAEGSCNSSVSAIQNDPHLDIFPNPAFNNTSITFTNYTENRSSVQVFNSIGEMQEINIEHCKKGTEEKWILHTDALQAGIYYCKVNIGGELLSRKLVIIK